MSTVPGTPPRRPAKRSTGLTPNTPVVPRPPPLDPAVEKALQLSTFESQYTSKSFIQTLSEPLITQSKGAQGAFNPKPFIETFSPALDALLSLRSQVGERTKKMEGEVRRAEREYGKRLRELDGGFEAIGSSFNNLESKITDVGRTAVRIGDQLDSLHQTRSTAQSTALLLSYYLSLSHQTTTTPDPNNPSANTTPLEALFATRTSRDGRARLAVILRRLMAVAKDLADGAGSALAEAEAGEGDATGGAKMVSKRKMEKEKSERVRDEIERYCERFEKEVLRLFDRSYRKGDPRMMAHCAKTLQDFNGGASCVQIYVNQHDFFISTNRVLEDAEKLNKEGDDGSGKQVDIWKNIGDPDAAAPTNEPGMEALFKEIRVTVSQEAQIVKAVFPDPSSVMQVFLRRVFAQVVQQHLETLISRATAISTLAVLRILHLTHAMCAALVEDLKTYDSTLASSASSSSATSSTGAVSGPLGMMLDHALEEIFIPWLEGSRYLESESKNLVELYGGLLSRFTRYHETVLKAKPNSLLDKVVNQLSTSSTVATSSSTAQAAAAAISKYANVFTQATSAATASLSTTAPTITKSPNVPTKSVLPPHMQVPGSGTPGTRTPGLQAPGLTRSDSMRGELVNKGLEEKVWATDGVVGVEMGERMLKWHAEAVGRVVELSGTGDVGKNAFALSKVLAEAIIRSFIETALDSALAKVENADTKFEPDLTPLAVLKPADQICHLWQRYTSTAILPLAGGSAAMRREMNSFGTNILVRLEGRVNTLLQKAIDRIIEWLSSLLTKQKKNDYKPKNDELSFARTNTEPCQLCCEFLDTVRDTGKERLSGKNGEGFLTEIGVAFHSLLLDHYKRFPVNPTGGLMLTKDLALYQETLAKFAIPAVNDRFDMLRQLGNSFIIQPDALKSYMTESHLGKIDARLLRPYLAQRSDYSQFSRSLQLDDGPLEPVPPPIPTISGLPQRENRSSLIRMNSTTARNRLSTMSGVAGAGMGKLKEMLKEFEALSPEEAALAQQREREARKRYLDSVGRMPPGTPGIGGGTGVPMYFGMR